MSDTAGAGGLSLGLVLPTRKVITMYYYYTTADHGQLHGLFDEYIHQERIKRPCARVSVVVETSTYG